MVMQAGASAYLLKTSAGSELFHAIEEALKGRSYVTKQIARGMQEAFIRDPQLKAQDKVLTPRQREVIQLLAEGNSMKEAACILGVTPRTGAFHKHHGRDWTQNDCPSRSVCCQEQHYRDLTASPPRPTSPCWEIAAAFCHDLGALTRPHAWNGFPN